MNAANPAPLAQASGAAPGAGVPRAAPMLLSVASWASLLAGFLTAFTISMVGEMPVGEFVLLATAGWVAASICAVRAWPCPLLAEPALKTLLAAQFVAFCSYVASDLIRHSSVRDMARGWSRMVLLAIDIVAVAYLFGRHPRNFVLLAMGLCLGEAAYALWFGAMFGDMWKFGVGVPLTFGAVLLASQAGPVAAVAAAVGLAVVHFSFDYRSEGGVCLLLAGLVMLQALPRRLRIWAAPLAIAAVAGGVLAIYGGVANLGQRATRSDVERTAMIQAAAEAFEQSPLLGHGSWFSNTNVYDNFLYIRRADASAAHVGGFADPNLDPGNMAIHSQILVTLAEGGLFGGAFFIVFGWQLLRTLGETVLGESWDKLSPLRILVLLDALWNLLFSPFSGAHRVSIAMACGVILLHRLKRRAARSAQPLSP